MKCTTTPLEKMRLCDLEEVIDSICELRYRYQYDAKSFDLLTEVIDIIERAEVYDV